MVKFNYELSKVNQYKWIFQKAEVNHTIDFLDFSESIEDVGIHPIVGMLDKICSTETGLRIERLWQDSNPLMLQTLPLGYVFLWQSVYLLQMYPC
jgi:hypothetical protein